MSSEIIKAISSVDLFHKNCILLFGDIVSTIKEKALADNVSNILGPEGGYGIWWNANANANVNGSDHQMLYMFRHNDQIRFICMFVKVKEVKLQTNSVGFKQICHELDINPIYPLIIVFGLFQPRDINRFLKIKGTNVLKNWMENTILLKVPEDIIEKVTRSTPYEFGKLLEIGTTDNAVSRYCCEKSLFKIQKLIDVKDSHGIESLVDDLLNINV